MAETNVTECRPTADTVVRSRRGPVVLVAVRDARVPRHYTEYGGGIFADMEGPTYMAIGRHVSDAGLVSFAESEGMKANQLIKFRDSIKIPRLMDLPSCNPNIAYVAMDEMTEDELEMTRLIFKEADIHFFAFPSREFLDKWDYDSAGATRAELLAAGAKNDGHFYEKAA